jgi:hypothetical protein
VEKIGLKKGILPNRNRPKNDLMRRFRYVG